MSSNSAGILMTAVYGTVATILGVITMYQVHRLWIKHHHHHHDERQAADIELDHSVCQPAAERLQTLEGIEASAASLHQPDQAHNGFHRDLQTSDPIMIQPFPEGDRSLALAVDASTWLYGGEEVCSNGGTPPPNTPRSWSPASTPPKESPVPAAKTMVDHGVSDGCGSLD